MNIKIEESNGKNTYWVNEISYDRIEDIPEEFKHHFSDTDNNGIPDQFDGLMKTVNRMGGNNSFRGLFKSLLSTENLKEIRPSTSAPAPTFSRGTNESSFIPTLIKIVIAGLIVSVVAWIYQKAQLKNSSEPGEITVLSDSTYQSPSDSPITTDRMTFIIDDPNEPPYHMLGVVSRNGEKILTFELPAGEEIESTDSSLQTAMPVKSETNLIDKTFTFSLLNQPCTSADGPGNTTLIGEINFNKVEDEEAGMGQQYKTYRYSFEKERQCIVFTLTLHSGIPEAFDPQSKEFDLDAEVQSVESILKTIRFVDPSSN
jgi:hypothetical protein